MLIESASLTSGVNKNRELLPREEILALAKGFHENPKPDLRETHDPTLPPIGQVVDCYTKELSNGELQLISISEKYENYEQIYFHNEILLRFYSKKYSYPFISYNTPPDICDITCERINFESPESYESFIQELSEFKYGHENNIQVLREELPDPQILITLAKDLIEMILAYSITAKVIDKIADGGIEKSFEFFKYIVKKFWKYAIPKKNGVAYVFILPGTPQVEFAAKINNTDQLLPALEIDSFTKHVNHAKLLSKELNATRIQYILNNGKWELNFLLTSKGEIIGTPKSFSHRKTKVIELFKNEDAK